MKHSSGIHWIVGLRGVLSRLTASAWTTPNAPWVASVVDGETWSLPPGAMETRHGHPYVEARRPPKLFSGGRSAGSKEATGSRWIGAEKNSMSRCPRERGSV